MAFARDPRTVEQDIDAPELSDGAPDDFLDLRFLGDVALERQSAPAERSNLSNELFCLTRVVIDHDEICAFPSESHDDRMSARILRAGNQDDFVLQSHKSISTDGCTNKQSLTNSESRCQSARWQDSCCMWTVCQRSIEIND